MKINHVDWLLNRIEELEKELNKQMNIGLKFEGEANELQKQNKRYREALEFYADEEVYKENLITKAEYDADGVCISNDEYAPPIIYFDRGEKARKSLKGE